MWRWIMNYDLSSQFEIKSGIHGIGVFATKDIKKGELIFTMEGKTVNHPTRTSVQIDAKLHIEDKIAGRINHSCTPNAKVDRKTKSFISLKDIKIGDEITFDYNQNEDTLASPFICHCCHRLITGKKQLQENKNSTDILSGLHH